MSNGGLDRMLGTLANIIRPTAQSSANAELVPALISILRHLVQANGARRRKMAHQSELYLMLVRGKFMFAVASQGGREYF